MRLKVLNIALLFLCNSLFSQTAFMPTYNRHLDSLLRQQTDLSSMENMGNIFFLGELHNYKYADETALLVFTKLLNKYRINTYCFEDGKSTEYLFYYYLQHGTLKTGNGILVDDIKLLKKSFINKCFEPLANLFKTDSTLLFKCYDIEVDLYGALSVINHILYNSQNRYLFAGITDRIAVPSIKKIKQYDECRFVISAFERDSLLYKNNLTPYDYYYVKEILKGIKPGIVFDSLSSLKLASDTSYNYREVFVAKNLNQLLTTSPKAFVQIGIDHLETHQGDITDPDFANFLPHLTDINYTKIGCVYSDIKDYSNYWLLDRPEIKTISSQIHNQYTLFNLMNLRNQYHTDFDYVLFCK